MVIKCFIYYILILISKTYTFFFTQWILSSAFVNCYCYMHNRINISFNINIY